jgi:hypothetical protein
MDPIEQAVGSFMKGATVGIAISAVFWLAIIGAITLVLRLVGALG